MNTNPSHLSSWIEIYFSSFVHQQRALFAQLSGDEDEFNSKEAQLLVSILSVLSQQLKPSSQQVWALVSDLHCTNSLTLISITNFFCPVCSDDHVDCKNLQGDQFWCVTGYLMLVFMLATVTCALRFVKFSHLEDSAFTKGLLTLLFNLHVLYKSPVNLLLELCQDIHSHLGDIDPVHSSQNSEHEQIGIRLSLKTTLKALIPLKIKSLGIYSSKLLRLHSHCRKKWRKSDILPIAIHIRFFFWTV